jgi:hypothetical protein
LQNEAAAARLRLRVAGAYPAIWPRNARTGAAVSTAISPSQMGGEGDQVAAVGADGVARVVRVRQVGEEVFDVAGEHVARQGIAGAPLCPCARSLPDNQDGSGLAAGRSRRRHAAMVAIVAR